MKITARLRISLLVVLALASVPSGATKTIVLQNSTRASLGSISIALSAAGVPYENVQYSILDANGTAVRHGTITLVLSAGTKASLLTHIDTVVLPAIDAAEGL